MMQSSLLNQFSREVQEKYTRKEDIIEKNVPSVEVSLKTSMKLAPSGALTTNGSRVTLAQAENPSTLSKWKRGDLLSNGSIFFSWEINTSTVKGPYSERVHFKTVSADKQHDKCLKAKMKWSNWRNKLENMASKILNDARRRCRLQNERQQQYALEHWRQSLIGLSEDERTLHPEPKVGEIAGVRNVSKEDIMKILQHGRCQKTGLGFSLTTKGFLKKGSGAHDPQRPSLDRIDPHNHWYEPGNIQLVCWTVNAARNCYEDHETLPILACLSSQMILDLPEQQKTLQTAAQEILHQFQSLDRKDDATDMSS